MRTQIRQIGNSSGTIIPKKYLDRLNLKDGDSIQIAEESGRLVITRDQGRPRYTLAERLAMCDENAPVPQELIDWDEDQPLGEEVL